MDVPDCHSTNMKLETMKTKTDEDSFSRDR